MQNRNSTKRQNLPMTFPRKFTHNIPNVCRLQSIPRISEADRTSVSDFEASTGQSSPREGKWRQPRNNKAGFSCALLLYELQQLTTATLSLSLLLSLVCIFKLNMQSNDAETILLMYVYYFYVTFISHKIQNLTRNISGMTSKNRKYYYTKIYPR